MKKLFLAVFVVFAFVSANAQDFNAGLSFGLPVGEATSDLPSGFNGNTHSFSIVLDVNYLWNVSEKFDAGIASGYSHSFGDKISYEDENVIITNIRVDDVGFLPIALAGRFNVSDKFTLGADLGYAIAITPSEIDGGFYYVPKVQYGISDAIAIVAAYRGISLDRGSFGNITLGIEFGF